MWNGHRLPLHQAQPVIVKQGQVHRFQGLKIVLAPLVPRGVLPVQKVVIQTDTHRADASEQQENTSCRRGRGNPESVPGQTRLQRPFRPVLACEVEQAVDAGKEGELGIQKHREGAEQAHLDAAAPGLEALRNGAGAEAVRGKRRFVCALAAVRPDAVCRQLGAD